MKRKFGILLCLLFVCALGLIPVRTVKAVSVDDEDVWMSEDGNFLVLAYKSNANGYLVSYLGNDKIVEIPESLDCNGVGEKNIIGVKEGCFSNNNNIEEVIVPVLMRFEYASFDNCKNLEKITFTGEVNVEEDFAHNCKSTLKVYYKKRYYIAKYDEWETNPWYLSTGDYSCLSTGTFVVTDPIFSFYTLEEITLPTLDVERTVTNLNTGFTDKIKLHYYNVDTSKVTYTIENFDPDIVSVSNKGKIKAKKEGDAKIIFNINYEGQTYVLNYRCLVKDMKLEMNGGNSLQIGDKSTINVSDFFGTSKKDIVWKSSNKKIVSVNSKGVVKCLKPGSVTITAKYKKTVADIEIRVTKPHVYPRSLKITKYCGDYVHMSYLGNTKVKKVWSTNNKVVKVKKYLDGANIKAKEVGKCKVYIKITGGYKYSVSVTVEPNMYKVEAMFKKDLQNYDDNTFHTQILKATYNGKAIKVKIKCFNKYPYTVSYFSRIQLGGYSNILYNKYIGVSPYSTKVITLTFKKDKYGNPISRYHTIDLRRNGVSIDYVTR